MSKYVVIYSYIKVNRFFHLNMMRYNEMILLFSYSKIKILEGPFRPCAIDCSFMVIYERKYERGMRSLFDYFSKVPKFLISLKKRVYLTF